MLKAAAEKIRQRAVQVIGPQLLWPGRGCVADLLFRFPDSRPDAVLCDSRAAADSIGKVLATDPVGEGIAVEFVPDRDWRFSHAAMAEMLADALERRHALPSGATMLIERCETLTAIDINTGSASSVAGPERVAIEVNKAAAGAIGRLVRLLNLSGNVVIDFVGLRSKTKQRELVDRLRSAFASDPAQPWIGGMSPIGLVEMSRRYLGPDLFERFGARRADRGEGA
jgi:Rne/Rng family ribonuclease